MTACNRHGQKHFESKAPSVGIIFFVQPLYLEVYIQIVRHEEVQISSYK